jgi:hypothetical protein
VKIHGWYNINIMSYVTSVAQVIWHNELKHYSFSMCVCIHVGIEYQHKGTILSTREDNFP